jgi:alkylglycerol monooxygenase
MQFDSNLILWAIPFYLGMMVFELFVSLMSSRVHYNMAETLSNLATAIVQQVFDVALNLLLLPFYLFIWKNFGAFNLELTLINILVFFILKDFMNYWTHRLSHENSFLWGIHVVHHQPKVYNYSVGLRVPLLHNVVDVFHMLVAALIGFPLEIYVITTVVWSSLQLFSHTMLIKNEIPYFSKIFVTPSHHRVHHAKNVIYRNKNYAGIFSVWDHFFGTYQKELASEPVVFGVKESEYTLNPIEANFIYWRKFQPVLQTNFYLIMNLLLLILAGSYYLFNAKTLDVIQTFTQSFLFLFLFSFWSRLFKRH